MFHYGRELNDGTNVLVFGSNTAGRHGKGAALEAKRDWGAVPGQGGGRQGQSYAIPTKDNNLRPLPLPFIHGAVDMFLLHAREHPKEKFLVTKVGCGLAGYLEEEIAPFFRGAGRNVILPEGWKSKL